VSHRRLAIAVLLLASASAVAEAPSHDTIVSGDWVYDTRAPFVVRDQNPLLAGFGLPTTMPSRLSWGGLSGGVDLYWGSTAIMQQHGEEALLVDAETREARLTVQGTLAERVGWQLQVPYRYTGGGTLDGFIDSWHDIFGLPPGARSQLPSDRIGIAYTSDGTRRLNVTSSAAGLGDIQVAFGKSLHSTAHHLAVWLSIKLPTGDADELTGSGSTDVSLLLAGQYLLNRHWSAFGQAAVTYLSDGDLLMDRQRSVVWSGMAGTSFLAWRGLSLKAQIDAHTAAYDSNLDFFSEAVVLTVGGDYIFESGWRLDLGVSEDVTVEHSPDVVFVLALKRGW
jgi:hypothetical protein